MMLELSLRGFLPGGGWDTRKATVRNAALAGGPPPYVVLSDRSRRKCALLGGVLTLLLTSMVGTPSALAQESCVTCHANHEFMIGVAGDSARGDALYVDPTEYAATVHGGFSS